MLLKPVLSGVLYAFFYEKWITSLGYGESNKRTNFGSFILGTGGNILIKYI